MSPEYWTVFQKLTAGLLWQRRTRTATVWLEDEVYSQLSSLGPSLHVLIVSVWLLSGCSGFLPLSKNTLHTGIWVDQRL